jgi:hypothetical protein
MKVPVKIKFQNGLSFNTGVDEILSELKTEFEFIDSSLPDFIVFGPYGNDIPPKGNYTRIGYFCENFTPDLTICEWAFGIPREEEINHNKYKRIQWHGLDSEALIKNMIPEDILDKKTKFCNFIYSNKVPYRETFFKQLSKYKKVDAPGKSMNNVPSFDHQLTGDMWQRKRQFLSEYKFTIAFENYVYPGYQTEKLYDAMQANSLPIYCGDPNIGEIFNTKSFINTPDYLNTGTALSNWLQKNCQMNFTDIRPQFFHNPAHRIQRKIKTIGRNLKMHLQFNKLDFSPLIERIIELDKNPDKYIGVLNEPWFKHNQPPENASLKSRWIEIFNSNPVLIR